MKPWVCDEHRHRRATEHRPARSAGPRVRADERVASLTRRDQQATEQAGHVSKRLRPDAVRLHATLATHVGRQLDVCWQLDDAGPLPGPAGRHQRRRQRPGRVVLLTVKEDDDAVSGGRRWRDLEGASAAVL
jgi:hypothetical protein